MLRIHACEVARYGGLPGLRDRAALEAAVGAAQAGHAYGYFHSYPFGMAAADAFHISQGQPFSDGNKRTALAAALAFLHTNGYAVCPCAADGLEDVMNGFATGQKGEHEMEALLRAEALPRSYTGA